MAEIVITEFMDEQAVADLAADHDVLYDPELVSRPEAIATAAAEARALIVRNRTQVTAELLAACPRLCAVGRLGVGLDNIAVEACRERNIAVLPATGANDVAVAEYVITGAMMLLRGAYHATDRVAAGEWPRQALSGRETGGTTLGLIGFGGIARATAERARPLGMHVLAHDPFVAADDAAWGQLAERADSLEALLAASDVVSLHVPYTADTHHLIDATALTRMPAGAVLINAARGGVVDEAAVAEALHAGRLGGALLDVFEQEPLPAGSVLADVPNLVLTPHIAGVTRESNVRVSRVTAENVRRVLEERRP
ncbi:hydroxyacid dehydrogenase [Sediminicurvatus halobius]|uniref:3-phosphoglycerate dehydrogenase n=1 Tax=Sediminicurvatus halobius TaxID=2182432 RepID=A0A2U2N8I5_9GAMM|nr:hydroxyacid dehydrogenase [Spiribacter halobius]PWG65440.1 3-phosphoglycerate dehydrogenase [Spiribacter halobius]UEX76460.1 hydroxyacid dehydrogenase [Spiribacter halobius]